MDEFIARDREEHPGCSYSTSSETSCHSSNSAHGGGLICDTIVKVTRMCPRERPMVIYSKKQSNVDASELEDGGALGLGGGLGGLFGGEPGAALGPWSALQDIFGAIDRQEQIPNGGFGGAPRPWGNISGAPGSGRGYRADRDSDFMPGSRSGPSEKV
jgi:hypothetical protein